MYVYTYLFYFICFPDSLIIYFAKFDSELHNVPWLAFLNAGCVFL